MAICKPNEIKINNKVADLPAQVLNFGVYEKRPISNGIYQPNSS